ncbi:Bug family tripartite tricarboxylate transporter substrate binding protein [Falsiroseomonas tokyonensis]|uniref:Bug family tripartite tricarboxylate transporter substrate binding protein n=1 Tax=Falsiroseomonas tokyonensis TaxID=430521 RepID=A0ABV7BLU6_9PROT|nr:tripartite tricarboxylate transporter substrate-binding protein [Falsiroseomonas tokyonensis]MBU8536547.1 tripartite tricarboxylate transporter substrate binding protein [Falsiroseomonas tokyonensis]
MKRRNLLAAAVTAGIVPVARAQGRPVRLVVPAPPGGAIDLIGRLYAQRLAARGGPGWLVENRAGGNNTIGAAEVARSAPDGATFLVNADIHLMGRRVVPGLTYDPIADFTPIARLATAPLVIVGHPEASRAATLAELAERMKAEPRRYTLSTSGAGSMAHLAAEGLKRRIGAAEAEVVHYRGTAPAINDVVAGNVALMVAPLLSAQPLIQAGRLRAFAVVSPTRSSAMPDVPSVEEAGLSGLHFLLWYAVWAPRGFSPDAAATLAQQLNAIGREAEIAQRLAAMGAEAFTGDTPQSFAAFIAEEDAKNARIAEAAGIKPE